MVCFYIVHVNTKYNMIPGQSIRTHSPYVTHYFRYNVSNAIFPANHIPWQTWQHHLTTLTIFLDNADNTPWQRWQHSLKKLIRLFDNTENTDFSRHNAILYNIRYIILYNIIGYNIMHYKVIRFNVTRYKDIRFDVSPYHVIRFKGIPYDKIGYSIIPYNAIPYNVII